MFLLVISNCRSETQHSPVLSKIRNQVQASSSIILMAALVEFISDRVLSSCKSACKEDPKLRSYISALRERMDKLMETVTGRGGKTGKPSKEDSIIKISDF
ncbi:unnamed protein product [Arabidopsis thaliana]|uniref:Uncharacterized protein n=1 Tax=Arabidopsis thaliana TaxID=3702 RepID=A0A5S9XJ02_ARATH|nr:unnamed protein product [Arabidopsis thaliana]